MSGLSQYAWVWNYDIEIDNTYNKANHLKHDRQLGQQGEFLFPTSTNKLLRLMDVKAYYNQVQSLDKIQSEQDSKIGTNIMSSIRHIFQKIIEWNPIAPFLT